MARSTDSRRARLLELPPAKTHRGEPAKDKALQAARRSQAVTYRLAGMTYEAIAEATGYSTGGAVRTAVLRSLTQYENEAVDELRALENSRLDRLLAGIWGQAIGGDLGAVNTALRISERRARLNGLDAPMRVEVGDSVRAEIEALLDTVIPGTLAPVVPERADF